MLTSRRIALLPFLLASIAVAPSCGGSGSGGGGGSGGGVGDGGTGGGTGSDGGLGGGAGGGVGGGAGGGVGGGAGGGVGGGAGGGAGGGTGGGGGPAECVVTACPDGNVVYACGDCVDNDGDGKMDTGGDPDCLGPCHNNEAGYAIGLTGQPETQCRVDCYYDSNSGRGCDWSWECDPLEPRIDGSSASQCDYVGDDEYGPTCSGSCDGVIGSDSCYEVSQGHDDPGECEYCTSLTPPGCDCFGCCEIPARSGNFVFIGSRDENDVRTCDFDAATAEYAMGSGTPEERLATLGQDARECKLCTPITTCYRPCEATGCQLCLGETEPPPGCEPPPPDAGPDPEVCNGGPSCAPLSDNVCPPGTFCFFGCCDTFNPV